MSSLFVVGVLIFIALKGGKEMKLPEEQVSLVMENSFGRGRNMKM